MLQRSVPYLDDIPPYVYGRSSWSLETSALVPKCRDQKDEVSGPMVRIVSALGPTCLSAEIYILAPKCPDTSAPVPSCP